MASTKKSLLASGLALLASVALLAGTTFAWFTDSVTNTGNRIQAGSLLINAYAYDLAEGDTFTIEGVNDSNGFAFEPDSARQDLKEDSTPIITEENWEPGQSSAKLLKVENGGTLAAKIKLEFSVNDGGLMDALWFDFIQVENGEPTGTFTKRPMNTLAAFAQGLELPLLENGDSVEFILVYGMYEEAGNEYQGDSFSADVTILAKQTPKEEDGFGNPDYDENATYFTEVSTAEEFTQAIADAAANETVQLTTNIAINNVIPQSSSGNTSIDLNGNTLSVSAGGRNAIVQSGDTMTIENGTIESSSTNLDFGVNAGGTLTLQNVEYTGPGFQPGGQDATINIVDSTVTSNTFCVSTNASVVDGTVPAAGVCINIIRSELIARAAGFDNTCILFNVPGTLYIEDSTLSAQRQALIVRGGDAVIKNSTVETTGEFTDRDYLDGNWGSGNEVPRAAIVIGNRSSSSYQYPASCTLINTNVTAGNEAKTIYMWGNSETNSATLTYDADCAVGEVVEGNDFVTVNGQ